MFFLLAVCDIPDPDEREVESALGVDLGVTNIATTSDGDIMTSEPIEQNRQRMQQLRSSLQARGVAVGQTPLEKAVWTPAALPERHQSSNQQASR